MITGISRHLYEKGLGLLLIRVGVGLVFLMHGWSKYQNMEMVQGFFSNGLGLPVWVASAIALLEVVGGLLLIFGVATRLFAFLLGTEMLVAIFLTGFAAGWQKHELEALLMAVSFGLVYTGSGRFSFFRAECEHCGGMLCRIEDCPKRA